MVNCTCLASNFTRQIFDTIRQQVTDPLILIQQWCVTKHCGTIRTMHSAFPLESDMLVKTPHSCVRVSRKQCAPSKPHHSTTPYDEDQIVGESSSPRRSLGRLTRSNGKYDPEHGTIIILVINWSQCLGGIDTIRAVYIKTYRRVLEDTTWPQYKISPTCWDNSKRDLYDTKYSKSMETRISPVP